MPQVRLEPISTRTTVNELVELVENVAGVARGKIGRVQVANGFATVEVPPSAVAPTIEALTNHTWKNHRLRASRIEPATHASNAPVSSEAHFDRLSTLLDLESKAEAQRVVERNRRLSRQAAEAAGNTLVDLAVVEEDAGLGGRFLLRLAKRGRRPLPWTRLDIGAPVVLSPDAERPGEGARGVMSQKDERAIQVAFNQLPDGLGDVEAWRVDLANDDIALARQRAALSAARDLRGAPMARLRDVLLGLAPPEFGRLWAEASLNHSLNDSQLDAVCFAMAARDVALIHGPPGTGKTTAVVEVIRRAARHGHKVLACAPSNLGVDNLFERLLAAGERVVRVGHPARVLPELRSHTLDMQVERHPDVYLARKITKQALALFRQAGRWSRSREFASQRRALRDEARGLLADARRLEAQAVEHVLDTARVVCATTTGVDGELFGNRQFDLVVIDEACQSTEPGCWIPLLRAKRVVLAGDHCQLPPTIISGEAQQQGFGVSLFERLMHHYGESASRRLSVQYRMHNQIMQFPSEQFYDDALVADESVAGHRLCDLPSVDPLPLTDVPVEFIDTAGASYDEQTDPDGESRMNPGEADLIGRKVRQLLAAGIAPQAIAVIAPYSAQVRHLRGQIDVAGLEIDSVDGFQGREKEAVIIGLVRSNPRGEIGFLADVRRMNVAMTRARRKLIVIGDSATLASHPFYQQLLEHFEAIGAYRTVWEEPDEPYAA